MLHQIQERPNVICKIVGWDSDVIDVTHGGDPYAGGQPADLYRRSMRGATYLLHESPDGEQHRVLWEPNTDTALGDSVECEIVLHQIHL